MTVAWLPRLSSVLVTATVAAAVAATTVVVVRSGGPRSDDPSPTSARPVSTAQITRQTLVDAAVVPGELGYGQAEPLESKAAGTVTWLPDLGVIVARGDAVLRVDDKPVVLLYGALPMYRELALGSKGTDVRQLETNLRELGYGGFTVDEEYSEATVTAVKRWQKKLRVEETGAVDLAMVMYVRDAVRVAGRSIRIGASAAGEVLTYTAVTKVVTITAEVGTTDWASVGTAVTVTLPGGKTVAGVVAAIGTQASASPTDRDGSAGTPATGASGAATVPVTVSLADQSELGQLERAPVEVRYTTRERRDVLTVPVAALLAPAEGGYGLEVVEGSGTRVVAVETGLFADGRVEVRGDGIEAGMTVRMPA